MQASSSLAKNSEEADEYTVCSIRLPRELWKSARVEAVNTDTTIGAYVEAAIREKLARPKRKG